MSASTIAPARRVLVVGGNPVDRARLQTLLAEAGYAVDTAIDRTHAAELVALRHYGLVVARSNAEYLADRSIPILVIETSADAELLAMVGEHLGPPPRKQDPPLIDRERLDRMRADTAADLFSKLLRHYLDGGPEHLARIAALVERDDLAAAVREAHDFKGIAATFGAPRLKDGAAVLENAAKAQNSDAVRTALANLRPLAEETWALLERELLQGNPS